MLHDGYLTGKELAILPNIGNMSLWHDYTMLFLSRLWSDVYADFVFKFSMILTRYITFGFFFLTNMRINVLFWSHWRIATTYTYENKWLFKTFITARFLGDNCSFQILRKMNDALFIETKIRLLGLIHQNVCKKAIPSIAFRNIIFKEDLLNYFMHQHVNIF